MATPKFYSIVSGKGESEYRLVAFDNALLDAGIGDYNLVKVSSIIPSHCTFQDTIDIPKGSILYAAYAEKTVQNDQTGATAVAVAIPKNSNENGVIYENSSDTNVKQIVQNMCKEAMSNRGRSIAEIKCSSMEIKGVPDKYVCCISAVVMW